MACKQICQISRLTKICPAPRHDDGVFEVGKPWQNLVDLKITGRTCLRELVTDFFAKQTKICPVRPDPLIKYRKKTNKYFFF